MKVLHTIPSMGVHSGGTTTCTYQLLRGLQQQGIDVDVLSFPLTVGDRYPGFGDFYKTVSRNVKNKILYSPEYYKYLQQHPDYDIYHSNSLWQYPSHATAVYARKAGKPYLMTPHGMLYPEALNRSRWVKKAYSVLWQNKDLVKASCIQVTCEQELDVIRNLGLKVPVAIVPNAIDISIIQYSDHFQSKNTKVVLGYLGRLHPRKRVESIIKAMSLLPVSIKNRIELSVIGSGEQVYEKSLQLLVEKLGMEDQIVFHGFLTGRQKIEAIERLSFLVVPSDFENFGMIIPEALVQGIPVIASKGTPWEELQTHHCGWWIDNDVDTIAATLCTAIQLPEEERFAMGQRGRQLIIHNYATDVVAEKMKSVYQWLLGGDKPDCVYTE